MSDDGDPFEDFEKPDDEIDPFADLDADGEEGGDDDPADTTDTTDAADPAAPFEEETDPGRLPDDPFSNRDREGPARPPERNADAPTAADSGVDDSDAAPDPTGAAPDPTGAGPEMDEESVPDADDGDPFADLGGGPQPRIRTGADSDDPFESFESVEVGEVDPDEIWANLGSLDDPTEQFEGKVYYEVSKHRFCEQCPHFSGPPETTCTLDGADIVEFVDMETVRLVNCPIVAEQEELGEDVHRYEPE